MSKDFISLSKKIFVSICLLYAISQHFLVALILKNQGYQVGFAVISMALTLIIIWVVIGGLLQRRLLRTHYETLTAPRKSPILYFVVFATALACLEEAITVSLTNLAPLYGVGIGKAYITASTHYFDVIFFHSVIIFIPMFVTLGIILKRYAISPFSALILWGIVGVLAETLSGGTQAITSAPSWIFIYGLMVYLPAYSFITLQRKKPHLLLYPLFIILILLSAIVTVWIPGVLDHPPIHFQPITLLQ